MAESSPLRAWEDAPAFLLSCPGPLRRHHAALTPVSQLALPQCLLGFEAQLAAFAAAFPALAPRMLFAPLPEMFPTLDSLAAQAPLPIGNAGALPVHLRFGSPRVGRVLKPARNAAVIAERAARPPITASQHPFASGRVLPAAVRRAFLYAPDALPVRTAAGWRVPATRLPAACITADLDQARAAPAPADAEHPGLDLMSFVEFQSGAWAAGPVRARSAHLAQAMRRGARFVLLPWNLDDPGAIVPELLIRLGELQDAEAPMVHPLLLPFNYPGQIGLIRRLIARVRNAAAEPRAVLARSFIGRLTRLSALPLLLRLSATAWVDGNDPEHGWTLRRLRAVGVSPILLDGGEAPAPLRVAADETLWIEAETRWGHLSFQSSIPSRRALPGLLALTASCRAEPEAPARARSRA